MKTKVIKVGENEYWWGGHVDCADEMPVNGTSRKRYRMLLNDSYNQINPVFLSSHGRYIWSDDYFDISYYDGEITVSYEGELVVWEEGSCLADAYNAASNAHFKFDGVVPPKEVFALPQYNTWISLLYKQSAEKVLDYAKSIVANGQNGGVLIIDEGWQRDYGEWEFNRYFPDPAAMIKELQGMGFSVMLWAVPYISPDSNAYRKLKSKDALVKNPDGSPYIFEWWEGYSALLDISSEYGYDWILSKFKNLQEKYGVDGFKLDGGDGRYIKDNIVTAGNLTANGYSELWAKIGSKFPLNELRACCKCGGLPIVQRVADRHHVWNDTHGICGLVAKGVTQSLVGYPYFCPDMVGGGLFSDFMGKGVSEIDTELFIRYCQAAALMPIMQFSFDYWRMLDPETVRICNNFARLHTEFGDYIYKYALNAAKTGVPIVRNMAYQFNELHGVRDQFMLGDDYLIAPVLEKGRRTQGVKLPTGKWKYVPDGTVFEGGREVTVDAPLSVLPYFERLG